MTIIPSVQYAKNDGFTLAYQVVGEGPRDLVYLPFETPNVVGNWFVPEHARFMERLASSRGSSSRIVAGWVFRPTPAGTGTDARRARRRPPRGDGDRVRIAGRGPRGLGDRVHRDARRRDASRPLRRTDPVVPLTQLAPIG